MSAEFFKIFLVGAQLLYLSRHSGVFVAISTIEFDLLLPVFFDFAGDVFEEVFGPLFEVIVHVDVVAVRMADLPEAVHVELADKGGKIAMFEVNGEDVFCKFADGVYAEGVTRGCPAYYLGIVSVLLYSINTSIIS